MRSPFQICLFFILLTQIFSKIKGAGEDLKLLDSSCRKNTNCSLCIQSPGCKWCTEMDFDVDRRCFYDESNSGCKEYENPSSSLLSSESLQSSSIVPSKAHIKLRPGDKVNVSMTYKDEENRPLDLYILMDLSCTMSPHKGRVAELAQSLANNLKNLTKNLRLGFGSFVDKHLQPFSHSEKSMTSKDRIICDGKEMAYVRPHSFKNHLPLTSNISLFTQTVNNSQILSNIDEPEGGLDALMQVTVCKNELKWRYENNTRRLVVLSTDGPFHIAGDGKLGGILLPNDGKCHLNSMGEYDAATSRDYPSVSQIRDVIQGHNIFLIFAVTKRYERLYKKLAKAIGQELTSVAVITEDGSSTITKVIEDEYKKVVRSVAFPSKLSNPLLEVNYYAKCPGSTTFANKNGCDNLLPNSTVDYKIELSLKRCPLKKGTKTSVAIRPTSFSPTSDESGHFLNLTLELICGCNCEQDETSSARFPKRASSRCNSNGYLECGICKCLENFGPFCNCSSGSERERCFSEEGSLCSERGKCICGTCQCDKGFVGAHCQCLEADCLQEKGDFGPCNSDLAQGSCDCKGCVCNEGFFGERCQCPTSTDACSVGGIICGGFGKCECGKCICNSGFHSSHCQVRAVVDPLTGACKAELKSKVEVCLKCLVFEKKKCEAECNANNISQTFQSRLESRKGNECEGKLIEETTLCELRYILVGQDIHTGQIEVRAESEVKCPTPAPILEIVLSVIGAFLGIGLATIFLWKIFTHFHDRKEFEKFEKERANAAWTTNQNPLYKATVSQFQNPMYALEEE